MSCNTLIKVLAIAAIVYFFFVRKEPYKPLNDNVYLCQSQCQDRKAGEIWSWENYGNKNGDYFSTCMLECMGIESKMENKLGYTTSQTVQGEYVYTPSSP